jgi:hypothetical protein
MTLSTVVALTSCFSNLAVLVSLVFLLRQLRQSARHQQATVRHGRIQQLQMIYQQASEGDFTETVLRGYAGDASLDRADCNRFVWFASTLFNMFENMFDQHRDGIIDRDTFASSILSMRSQLALPGMRAAWMVVRERYEKIYAHYVDRLLATTPADGAPDLSTAWRGFASEISGKGAATAAHPPSV